VLEQARRKLDELTDIAAAPELVEGAAHGAGQNYCSLQARATTGGPRRRVTFRIRRPSAMRADELNGKEEERPES
jgi:hypothetical protein